AGERRLDLRLAGDPPGFQLGLEGELADQFLGHLGAGVGIDPDTHERTSVEMTTASILFYDGVA
ncbi:hypothetical protein TI06_23800, partial [Vibrio vulnificus]